MVGLLRSNKDAVHKIKNLINLDSGLYTSAINAHELVKGAYLSNNHEENIEKVGLLLQRINIVLFDMESAYLSGKISAQKEIQGKPVGQNDIFIAAAAIKNRLKLVTRNKKHFENIRDLEIEEW